MINTILQYTTLGINSVSVLFFPVDEGAKMAETDVPFVSHVSTGLTCVGGLSTLIGQIEDNVKAHPLIKWVVVPLVLLHVGVIVLLMGTLAMGSLDKFKVLGSKISSYVMPVVNGLLAGYVIYQMVADCKNQFNMTNTGKVVHKLPALLSYPPMNKHPFYVLVIFIRTGGIIMTFAGGLTELTGRKKG